MTTTPEAARAAYDAALATHNDTLIDAARTVLHAAEDATPQESAEDTIIRLENEARAAHKALTAAGDDLAAALAATAGILAARDVDTFTITAESGHRITIEVDLGADGGAFYDLAAHTPNPHDAPLEEHLGVRTLTGVLTTLNDWMSTYGEV